MITHMQHPSNSRSVPPGTDKEGNWMFRGHFHEDNTSRADRMLKSYTADSQTHDS